MELKHMPTVHIILVGRFFEGPQCKGHMEAMQRSDFQTCSRSIKPHLLVTSPLVRRIMSIDWGGSLKAKEFIKLNLRPDELWNLIAVADIVWSITGLSE